MLMSMKQSACAVFAGLLAISWVGCTDLRSGDDRADHDASVTTDGGAGMSGQSGGAGAGGMSGGGASGGGAGGEVSPVPPSVTRFSTLGEARGGDGISVRDDGFEFGERRCTANEALCVTGGFAP